MKRVCVVGNSHVAAIKDGAEILRSKGLLDEINITIFGSHSDSLRTSQIKDGIISTDDEIVQKTFQWTSEGLLKIDMDDYDEFFILLGASIYSTFPFWAGNLRAPHYDVPRISNDLVSEIQNSVLGRWYVRLAKAMAKERPDRPVIHVGVPFRSEEHPLSKRILEKMEKADTHLLGRFERMRAQVHHRVAEAVNENFKIASPPPATLEKFGLFTRHEFCRGSRRLVKNSDLEHPANDFSHMNSVYGEAVLTRLLGLG